MKKLFVVALLAVPFFFTIGKSESRCTLITNGDGSCLWLETSQNSGTYKWYCCNDGGSNCDLKDTSNDIWLRENRKLG